MRLKLRRMLCNPTYNHKVRIIYYTFQSCRFAIALRLYNCWSFCLLRKCVLSLKLPKPTYTWTWAELFETFTPSQKIFVCIGICAKFDSGCFRLVVVAATVVVSFSIHVLAWRMTTAVMAAAAKRLMYCLILPSPRNEWAVRKQKSFDASLR